MQKVVISHSVTVLRAMTPAELDALAIQAAETVKEAKESARFSQASNPATGKVICVLEERLERAKTENLIAKNTSLAKYWEGITKSKMPNHAMTCAVCFGSFVRTEKIDEKTYDLCSANIIEVAGAISNAVDGDLTNPAIEEAAVQLKEHRKDAPKNLKAILKRVKPAKPMDAETAQERLQAIFDDGHLNLVIAGVGAEMCYQTGDEAKASYFCLVSAGVLVDKHFGAEADAWIEERNKLVAKPEVVSTPAPQAA